MIKDKLFKYKNKKNCLNLGYKMEIGLMDNLNHQ